MFERGLYQQPVRLRAPARASGLPWLTAQLAARHHDDVHDRNRGEEGEDPSEHRQARDGDEGSRAKGAYDQAEARQDQAEGERAARGGAPANPAKGS